MLRKLSKDNKKPLSKPQKLQKKLKTVPISESFSDLKYLSSLCFTNFNGIFQNQVDSNKKNNELSETNESLGNLIINEQLDGSTKHASVPSTYNKLYPSSTVYSKLNSKSSISKKNLNASTSTRSSLPDEYTTIKQKTISTKYNTLTPSSNQVVFKKINSTKKKGGLSRSQTQPRFQKLTKINKNSNLSSIQDFENALNTLQSTYLMKMRDKLSNNQKASQALASSIKKLSNHVRSISQEFDRSREINISMTNESVKMGYDLKRLLIQNKNVSTEIQAYREACDNSRKMINELTAEKIKYENEISNNDEGISEMKKQIKLLPDLIKRCEEDKKNLMTAILIVKKKSDEIRAEIYKMDNNKDYLGQDLETILDYYKNAEV